MNHKTILFTAGQFAKLHSINKRTLHYYDEIGLFSPSEKGDNGYRYYTYLQSPTLEMILTLRELGMSIDEISDYMKHRSRSTFQSLIKTKKKEIDQTIKRLKNMRTLLDKKDKMITFCEEHDLTQIDLLEYPEEYLLLSQHITGDDDEKDYTILMEHQKALKEHRLFSEQYGCMISMQKIYNKDMTSYDCFFSKIDKKIGYRELYRKPKGIYLRAFCIGEWDHLPATYRRIMKYAQDHKLTLTGYAFEEGVNEMTIHHMDEYITQITILCEEETVVKR